MALTSSAGTPTPSAEQKALIVSANNRFKEFLYEDGLYREIDLTTVLGAVIKKMVSDRSFYITHDLFCPYCEMVTTYELRPAAIETPETRTRYALSSKPNLIAINSVCLRENHFLTFVIFQNAKSIIKIGQWPNIATLGFSELRNLRRHLPKLDIEELSKAIGLFAHDAHLGAFVYLRRVFERMILRAHERHVAAGKPVVVDFETSHMEDRIQAVKDQLPSSVVKNRRVFAVLSKTIHELSELDAQRIFPVLKQVIFQMLSEEEQLREATRQIEATNAAFRTILDEMSN